MANNKVTERDLNELEKIRRGADDDRGEDEVHESYGVVTVSRYSGHTNLFDVSTPQQHFIGLRVHEAIRYRNLSKDRVHGRKEIIEIWLSETQFARMLSSIGVGEGVPCTIHRVQGKEMKEPPPNDMGAKLKLDMKRKTERISNLMREMDEILTALTQEKRVSKKQLKEVQDRMYHARMNLDKNMPYILDQAVEQLEGAIAEARANIDAYQKHQAMKLGLSVVTAAAALAEGEED